MDIRKTWDMAEKGLSRVETGNFKNIKPQNEISLTDARNFWNQKFMLDSGNMQYERNGSKYYCDDKTRIIKCEAKPQYTEDGVRNIKEQLEAGGSERREDD